MSTNPTKNKTFDTSPPETKTMVLHVHYPKGSLLSPEEVIWQLDEAVGLAHAIDLQIVYKQVIQLSKITPSTLLGKGVVQSMAQKIAEEDISLVILDAALSPSQQRNLEKAWKCKVIDRTSLILEIFGKRAATAEGRLQVELATLSYQRTRLIRTWTHLERQRGGFGFTGGPGEKQLELDRRMIENRIVKIKEQLEKIKKTRTLQRTARKEVPYPLIALVGYTNAGKSTLFNALSKAGVLAKEMLFATLDPTMRQVKLPSGRGVILSDTVGFISHLPTQLVAAFRATLEEVCAADIILHVRDASHPLAHQQAREVMSILIELGLETKLLDGSIIDVYNKIDLLDPEAQNVLINSIVYQQNALCENSSPAILISASEGRGLQDLLLRIDTQLNRAHQTMELELPVTAGEALAWLYRQGAILRRQDKEEFMYLEVQLTQENFTKFKNYFKEVLV